MGRTLFVVFVEEFKVQSVTEDFYHAYNVFEEGDDGNIALQQREIKYYNH